MMSLLPTMNIFRCIWKLSYDIPLTLAAKMEYIILGCILCRLLEKRRIGWEEGDFRKLLLNNKHLSKMIRGG